MQIIHRAIATFLIEQTGISRTEAATSAVTLIQRFGSAATLNIHLHALVLDGVYGKLNAADTAGTPDESTPIPAPIFHPAPAPTHAELQALLGKIITRLLRLLTRLGHLIEEEGETYLAGSFIDPDDVMAPLQAAASTYRIAYGPRAGQKLLSLQLAPRRLPANGEAIRAHCANAHGFSLHAGDCAHPPASSAKGRMRWAQWLKHVFDIDIKHSPHCGGQLKLIAAIEEPTVIQRILTHLGLAAQPPPRAPARRVDLLQAA